MPPKVITLCGSSRFVDVMAVCAWLLEKEEHVITMDLHLLPAWYCRQNIPDHLAEHEGVADAMDELHLRKIDLSDGIFVVNCNDYIGESTTREVEYAIANKKPVRWYTDDYIGSAVQKLIEDFVAEEAAPTGNAHETEG